ncbi:MAG: hypothetical protein GEU78_13100 [Actinobacteria bacterium]|nr:hypothetical protein [Actinomycetota bacterium]
MKRFFWRWQRRLPSPSTAADLRAGYVYDLAFRQFEISDTQVFDRPAAGRAFFEGVIRDHLDVGRPDQVALIFDRRLRHNTPGTFRTKVITKGVDPQITCYYKSSRIKQYFKEHRALRTETVVGDTRDFGIGRRVTADNWNALRAAGEHANKRLRDAQAADAHPAPDVVTFAKVTQPSNDDGLHAPALRFGDPRAMALLAALVNFAHLLAGFTNRPTRRAGRHPARHRLHQPPGHLRPAPPQTQGAHHPPSRHLPIPAHAHRPGGRGAVHQGLRPRAHLRPGSLRPRPPGRDRQTQPARLHRRRATRGRVKVDRKLDLLVNFKTPKSA